MYLRKADIKEIDYLSELVYNSEKSLGFDESYMSIFKDKYNINKEFIKNNPSYCMIEDDNIIGFFGLQNNEPAYELEFFYINSDYLGKGYGKIMFQLLIEQFKALNIREINLVTSPESIEFYTKLGAVKIGETKSLIDCNRIIPKLKFIIN